MTETPRDKQIQDLLRTYRDLQGTSTSGTGQRNGGDRLLYNGGKLTVTGHWIWDAEWDKTGCDKLDQLLADLKAERPTQWWHVTERYLRCDTRARTYTAHRTNSGKRILPTLGPNTEAIGEPIRLTTGSWLTSGEMRVVVETWSTQVLPHETQHGVRYLSTRFPWQNFKWRDLETAAA